MTVARSPNYPALDLAAALALVKPVLDEENRNKMSRLTLAEHLGYTSLNGRALGVIGALRAYGLIDGSGDEVRVSDDAVTAMLAPKGSPERYDALLACASKPNVFKAAHQTFPQSLPSESNLTYWLVKRGFTQEGAAKAAKVYLDTMRLVVDESPGYPAKSEAVSEESVVVPSKPPSDAPTALPAQSLGMRTAVFTLIHGGDVRLTFPADLDVSSFEEMEGYLQLFLRNGKRQYEAKAQKLFNEIDAALPAKTN